MIAENPGAERPLWHSALDGFLKNIERGTMSDPHHIITGMGELACAFLQNSWVDNFGQIQAYLRRLGAPVQLVAHPVTETDPPVECIDLKTGEPRGHWLMITLSHPDMAGAEAEQVLAELKISPEVNETALARDTGVLRTPPNPSVDTP